MLKIKQVTYYFVCDMSFAVWHSVHLKSNLIPPLRILSPILKQKT